MSNKLFVCILLQILLVFQAITQDLSNIEQIPIVSEQFVDNSNNWSGIGIEDEQGSASILENNTCEIIAPGGNSMIIANDWAVETIRDFEIVCNFRIKDFRNESINSLITLSWGCSFENMYQYRFSCTPSKFAVVTKVTNSVQELLPAKSVNSFNLSGNNQLKIRKIENYYYYLVNGEEIGKTQFEPFFGDGIIITVGGGLTVLFDEFTIHYLSPKMEIKRLPRLALNQPFADYDKATTEESDFTISGLAMDEDGISGISINGNSIQHSNGNFSFQTPLILGNNLFKIEVIDNSGQLTSKYIEIERNEPKEKLIIGQKRLALVIGNSKYKHAAELRNTAKDAKDMSVLLEGMGFDVLSYTDLDYSSFIEVLREYSSKIHDYDMTLVFYAGHGIQVDDKNYLIPTDAKLGSKSDVDFETIEVEKVMNIMASTDDDNLNLLILDACRNNPFRSWSRGGPEGLAGMQPPSGILVAYSTSPGSYASDGLGENGLYTEELMKQLKVSQRVEDIFINTRIEVERRSGGKQSPWELARLRGKYFLK